MNFTRQQLEEVEEILSQLRAPIYPEEVAQLDKVITDYTTEKTDFLQYLIQPDFLFFPMYTLR